MNLDRVDLDSTAEFGFEVFVHLGCGDHGSRAKTSHPPPGAEDGGAALRHNGIA
jgi:hypothetical protein